MARIGHGRPAAVVLGMAPNGLSIARSLGRRGVQVIGIDQDPRMAGMSSKYCRAVHPPFDGAPDTHSAEWLEFLVKQAREFDKPPVLFPCHDGAILLMSRHRDVLEQYYRFALPPPHITEALINKVATYELAEKQGVPCPRTFTVRSHEELGELAPRLEYPCALKAVYSHLWRAAASYDKLVVVNSPDELVTAYRSAAGRGLEALITEIIPGGDERLYALYTYLDRSSQPLIVLTKRKIRQYPVDYGVGSLHVTEREPTVVALGLRLLQGIGYRGIAIPEFKLDPRDGQYKLMEVHVRCGLPIGLAAASGVDVPWIAYRDLTGDPPEPSDAFEEGVKWLCFEWDFFSFLEYRARGQLSLAQWLRSLRGKKTYAYFAWDDPDPFLVAFRDFLRHLAGRLIGRATRPSR